jgi:hypothetical protein
MPFLLVRFFDEINHPKMNNISLSVDFFVKVNHIQKVILILSIFILTVAARSEEASSGPTAESNNQAAEPFAFADFSWIPGNYAPTENPLATKYFTPELRVDNVYHYSFNHPADDTISGSSEVFRHNEFQTTQIGFGGDAHYKDVGIRLMTQFGMYSTTTARNDSSPSRGQWQLDNAYRYISEAYASYHLNVMNGINIQTGIGKFQDRCRMDFSRIC